MQLSRYKIRRSKVHHIFISHLHGDHYFGLIGLITSLGLMGREHPLYIHGPAMLQTITEMQLKAADTTLRFPLIFVPNEKAGVILSHPKMEVSCFPVQHRIECWGYVFREKLNPRKLVKDKALALGIPYQFFHNLQLGENFVKQDGSLIPNEAVTVPNHPGRVYAYSADTLYDESLCPVFEGADLLYHEATYLHDMADRAADRYHSTSRQAGMIAKKAGVKRLLLGHFSSKYEDLSPFLNEAKMEFEHTELGIEGVTYRIPEVSQTLSGTHVPSPSSGHSTAPMEA